MRSQLEYSTQMERELETAFTREEFVIHYQPIISLCPV